MSVFSISSQHIIANCCFFYFRVELEQVIRRTVLSICFVAACFSELLFLLLPCRVGAGGLKDGVIRLLYFVSAYYSKLLFLPLPCRVGASGLKDSAIYFVAACFSELLFLCFHVELEQVI